MDAISSQQTSGNNPGPLETVKAEAEKLKTTVKEEAGETAVKIKEETKAAVGHLRDAGRRFAETQQEALSGKAGEYAGAVNALCDKLKEGGETNLLAGPAQIAAEQLGVLSNYLKDSNPEEVLRGMGRLAQRKPELFYGGIFLTGLIAARFLKASGTRAAAKARDDQRKITPPAVRTSPAASAAYFKPSNV